MRVPYVKIFFILFTALLTGSTSFAQEICSPIPPDEVASMSDALKKATITNLHLKAYKTGDLNEKIACYDQILNLDPTDPTAKSEMDKAQSQLKDLADIAQKEQTRQSLLQNANAALAADDQMALANVLGDLDQALKTNPADKDLLDARQHVQDKLNQCKVGQQVRDAIEKAQTAYFAEDSTQLTDTLRGLEDALKVDPANAELNNWKQRIESRLRTERVLRWVKIVAVVAVFVGVLALCLYLLLRKKQGLLEFADGQRMGETFQLDKPAIKIGALSEGNDLVVTDSNGKISRYHCEIVREGRRYFVRDGSTNGTRLNEEYLESGRPRVLRKGDRLTLAGEVTLIFYLK
jgi:tetratricopeptide (TPR) repeat protein